MWGREVKVYVEGSRSSQSMWKVVEDESVCARWLKVTVYVGGGYRLNVCGRG